MEDRKTKKDGLKTEETMEGREQAFTEAGSEHTTRQDAVFLAKVEIANEKKHLAAMAANVAHREYLVAKRERVLQEREALQAKHEARLLKEHAALDARRQELDKQQLAVREDVEKQVRKLFAKRNVELKENGLERQRREDREACLVDVEEENVAVCATKDGSCNSTNDKMPSSVHHRPTPGKDSKRAGSLRATQMNMTTVSEKTMGVCDQMQKEGSSKNQKTKDESTVRNGGHRRRSPSGDMLSRKKSKAKVTRE